MAEDTEEVVIVDDQGTEHVFPAGFDPQKAAGIVRAATAPKTGEPGFVLPGGPGAAMMAGAKGFAKEAIPAVGKALVGLPAAAVGLIGEAFATAKGTGRLLDDPKGVLSDAWESVKEIPGATKEKVQEALTLAKTDPEAFGKAVADVTGQVGVAAATSKLVPLMPKALATRTGTLMEQVGTKGGWPIRMMGAHQLGSGNPLGIAMMAAPEGLKSGGRSLRMMGAEEGATAATLPTKLLKMRNDMATGAQTPKAVLDTVGTMQKDLGIRLAKAKLPEEVAALNKEQTALDTLQAKAAGLAKKTAIAEQSPYTPHEQEMLRRANNISTAPTKNAIPARSMPTTVPGKVLTAPTSVIAPPTTPTPKGIAIAGLETKGAPIMRPAPIALPVPERVPPLSTQQALSETPKAVRTQGPRVLLPDQAQFQEQRIRSAQANAREMGMESAARMPKAQVIQQLQEQGATPLEIQEYLRKNP